MCVSGCAKDTNQQIRTCYCDRSEAQQKFNMIRIGKTHSRTKMDACISSNQFFSCSAIVIEDEKGKIGCARFSREFNTVAADAVTMLHPESINSNKYIVRRGN